MEVPDRIELRVGDEYRLRLRGRGSAGFLWDLQITGDPSVVEISEKTVDERPSIETGGPPPAAGSLDHMFVIKGLKPGGVRLNLEQRRPRLDAAPLEEHTIDVAVHAV